MGGRWMVVFEGGRKVGGGGWQVGGGDWRCVEVIGDE